MIQECQVCENKDRLLSHGHGKKYNASFNTQVIGDEYYTHLFTLEYMDTGYTVARYINKFKYESRYDRLNCVALELWANGEDGNGFGIPMNAFFTPDPTDNIQRLRRTGRKDEIKWARSDLKLGKFRFSDCLDFTNGKPRDEGKPPFTP